jgi:hypothetical protein
MNCRNIPKIVSFELVGLTPLYADTGELFIVSSAATV